MILPKGQIIHKDLNTSFTNFEQLLSELRANQFTGYVSLASWKYNGALFLDSGNLVNALEETEGQRRTGLGALAGVRAKSKQKDGALSVYRLDGDLVGLMAASAQRSALYEKLSTDLTTFDRLLGKLQKEKLTGHVEIVLSDKSAGMMFLQDGTPLSTFHSSNGATLFGNEATDRLAALAANGASFNVYRSDPAIALGHDFVKLELIEAWQDLLVLVEQNVDGASEPGAFATQFKRGCLENVNAFPFLDPFVNAFEFKNGQIRFEGGANNAQFSAGLASAFTFAATKFDGRGAAALNHALETAAQSQRPALETWGIAQALPAFFR